MRMGTCARAVCVLTLLATPAGAQSTTEDGIRAVLRGDYQAAARILRPLADDAARPDPVAQFFLAILYHTAKGVRSDEGRACGLYLRSAAQAHPFAEQSAALARYIQEQLGGAASLLCLPEERWRGGPPQAFELGPGHRSVFADTNITVTFGHREQRATILHPPAAVFLPIPYTSLAVTRPVPTRRHFFQWFQWTPDKALNPSSWTLGWVLSEVVGDRWIPFKSEMSLAVVNGATRPGSLEVTNLIRLRVNASGEAELSILGGDSARVEVIPPQGSR